MIHDQAGIDINKITHAGRSYTAIHAREHGASSDGTKALGNWNTEAYWKCYDRVLPSDAMVAAASFNGAKKESYFVPRDVLGQQFHHFHFSTSDLISCLRTPSGAYEMHFPLD